ncbi:hypothetical protein K491DRAFT_711638 [Lophiostoma macrostomum CBS 122681]|uniref:BTB domain-containing protein n=1 Tax=Lophiostoma macrostomum CBS 122681 TaxID=1314788 RepID=A0A6A6TQ71_9PLEO|nr:hypothetical protein K491DRAFT_711638 [Lophiostoma macrostomum CBS 122681]
MAPLLDPRIETGTEAELDLSGEIVTVTVGRDEHTKRFLVHTSVICKRSKFFEKAMNGDWKEAQDKNIKFPEDDPEIFSIYVQLLYKGVLSTKKLLTSNTSEPSNVWRQEYAVLARVYVLAEMLMDVKSKNLVLDAMLSKAREEFEGVCYFPRLEMVKIIYEGTPSRSPARKFMVDCWSQITKGSGSLGTSSRDKIPKDFLCDLAITMLDLKADPNNGAKISTCDPTKYHEIDSDKAAE